MTDVSLQDLLLVQFVRHYGRSELEKVSAGLSLSPLLQKEIPTWTTQACDERYEAIAARENMTGAGDVDQLYTSLRTRKIQSIKDELFSDERLYSKLLVLPQRQPEVIEEQKVTNQATSKTEQVLKRPQTTHRRTKSGIATKKEKPVLLDSSPKALTPIPTPALPETVELPPQVASPADTSMTDPVVDESQKDPTKDNEGKPVLRSDATSSQVPTSVEADQEPKISDDTSEVEVKQERILHKTRSRSNTVNTAVSIDDAATNEDAELADQMLKKKSGRPAKVKRTTSADTPVRSRRTKSASPDMTADQIAAHKRFQGSIIPVLNNIAGHKFASIFSTPVSDKDAPNYSTVVKHPTDLRTIRAQVKSGEIDNSMAFYKAILRMLSNAIMFNPESSEVSKMARELFNACEGFFEMYRAAEVDPEEDEPTPKRRRRV